MSTPPFPPPPPHTHLTPESFGFTTRQQAQAFMSKAAVRSDQCGCLGEASLHHTFSAFSLFSFHPPSTRLSFCTSISACLLVTPPLSHPAWPFQPVTTTHPARPFQPVTPTQPARPLQPVIPPYTALSASHPTLLGPFSQSPHPARPFLPVTPLHSPFCLSPRPTLHGPFCLSPPLHGPFCLSPPHPSRPFQPVTPSQPLFFRTPFLVCLSVAVPQLLS